LSMRFRELKLRKDPECRLCGPEPSVTELIDYQQFCGVPSSDETHANSPAEWEISAPQLKERMKTNHLKLVDVREPHEWQIGTIEGATLIPLGEIPKRMNEFNSADEIVLYCKSGMRSMKALKLLRGAGFSKLKNLHGGINAWSREVDPNVPLY